MATNNAANFSEGTTGQLLVATTNTAPSFASSATGDFTFTSTTASQTRVLTVSNTDNTAAATSSANVQITVGGANVGDPTTTYTVTGATSFTEGIDNSASYAYKLSIGTALGTSDAFIMTTAGEMTMPLQPAFLAYNSAQDDNVTGDGTTYVIICDTEIFDQNSDYNNSTGTFTAPVTGRYQFYASTALTGITAAQVSGIQSILTSNRNYASGFKNWFTAAVSGEQWDNFSVLTDMDVADTAVSRAMQSGVGKIVDVMGNTDMRTSFGGYLAC